MRTHLDHIGIVVRSIETALPLYTDLLEIRCVATEVVEQDRVRVALLPVGFPRVELLEPLDAESPVGRFLARRGEGLHHICYSVANAHEAFARFTAAGITPIDPAPRAGAGGSLVFFLHPRDAHGVLIEIAQVASRSAIGDPALARIFADGFGRIRL